MLTREERGKWASSITFNNQARRLGCFIDEEEAAKAYDCAAKELFGEFALLNFS